MYSPEWIIIMQPTCTENEAFEGSIASRDSCCVKLVRVEDIRLQQNCIGQHILNQDISGHSLSFKCYSQNNSAAHFVQDSSSSSCSEYSDTNTPSHTELVAGTRRQAKTRRQQSHEIIEDPEEWLKKVSRGIEFKVLFEEVNGTQKRIWVHFLQDFVEGTALLLLILTERSYKTQSAHI